MHNSIKFKYNLENSIFYKYYLGEIYLNDVINSWNEIINNNSIPKNCKGFIVDLSKSTIKMSIQESTGISEYYKSQLELFGGKKIAYITNNPIQTVYSMLVEKKDKGYQTKTFNSIDASEEWILQ